MTILWAALLAVAVGVVVRAVALEMLTVDGEQREHVAFVLTIAAGAVTFCIPLLVEFVEWVQS